MRQGDGVVFSQHVRLPQNFNRANVARFFEEKITEFQTPSKEATQETITETAPETPFMKEFRDVKEGIQTLVTSNEIEQVVNVR